MNRLRSTITIGVLLGCIASFIIACASTARLPENINIIPPSPDLPSEIAAFSGFWKGKWSGYQEIIIIVETINLKKARVIISHGMIEGYESRYFYRSFKVEDGPVLRIVYPNGDQMSLRLDENINILHSTFIENKTGAKWIADLYKQNTI